MSIRRDEVQISIAFLTDESKQYAKLVQENQQFVKDLKQAKKEGKDLTDVVQKMAASGQAISKIPLDKLAPTQLIQRAQQLKQVLDLIPQSAPEYKVLEGEYAAINSQLATMRARTKGVADAMDNAKAQGGLLARVLETVMGVFGGLSLQSAVQSLWTYGKQLFNVGVSSDFFAQKTRTVFGEAEVLVKGASEKMANSLGFTKKAFIDAATRAGDLLVPMGFTQKAAAQLSIDLTKQAGVLSQWSGGTVDAKEAQDVLTKALLGERDALQSLGIKITEDLLKAELRKNGQDKLTGSALRQAEALATLKLITEQSAAANEQFDSASGNLVKTQAQLTARIAEISDRMATALVPVFAFFINLAEKTLTVLIGLARGFAAIPQFVAENRVEIGALLVALVSLNATAIAAAANTLRMAVVQRAAAIATGAQTAAQWLLNAALTANPIGLVVAALGALVVGLTQAYKRSETFREVIDGVFGSVKNAILNVVDGLKAFAGGFSKIFDGDFKGAAEDFKNSFERLNPVGLGKSLVDGFQKGYQDAKDKNALAKILQEQEDARQAKLAEVRANDAANAKTEREKIVVNGKLDAKAAGAAKKEALDAEIKEVELAKGREEIALDVAKLKREIGETEFAKRMFDLKKSSYEQELAIFKKYGLDQQKEALETQKKLLELEASRPQKLAAVPQIGTRATLGAVTSQTAGGQDAISEKTSAIEAQSDAEMAALRQKFAGQAALEIEQENNLARGRVDAFNRKLEMLRAAGLAETETYKQTLTEKTAAEESYAKTVADNEKRTVELKRAANDAALGIAKDALSVGIELLGKDAAARKKHAGAIKAFEIGSIVVDSTKEIAGIWRNANSNPINALIPGWGAAFAAVQTALALARTKVAIGKVTAQKFASGGFTGAGMPFTDETGHRPAGVVHGGEWVSPQWMVNSPKYAPIISALESERLRGFALGGNVPIINTTPTPGPSRNSMGGAAGMDFSQFTATVEMMGQIVANMPREVKGKWVYSDLEKTADEITSVRSNAAL